MAAPTSKPITGLRKRQQIEITNKRIFVWVAVTSVIVSFCIVALQFLIKEFIFNQQVINQKSETNQRLIDNVEAGKELTKNVNTLLADSNLGAVARTYTEEEAASTLNVILDALPVSGDATSFANSLQTVVLPLSGVGIKELSTSVDQGEVTDGSLATTAATDVPTLPFKASFSGTYDETRQALVDITRVIRPIHLTKLSIRSDDDNKLQVAIEGLTYYLPSRTIDVTKEVRKP